LGFTVVVMQGHDTPKKDRALRATGYANMIEEYCHVTLPDVLTAREATDTALIDQTISRLKVNLESKHEAKLPDTREALLRVHDRLTSRASDDALADSVLRLLEEEIKQAAGNDNAHAVSNDTSKSFEVCERMTTAIVEIIREQGGCLPQDLFARGF